MPDIAGDSSTTSNVTVGSIVTSEIDVSNDQDWFRIELVAGQSITIRLNSSGSNPLGDPYLRLRNSSGALIAENDDSGDGLNSQLSFTASTTGTYYIDAGAWRNPSTGQTSTGQYTLEITQFTPPPVGTVAQLANQLTHGYWDGASHHFNVTPGGSLTVNLTGLAADGQNLARLALRQWSDIIGVTFVEVLSGGQILFTQNEEGAFSSSSYSNGITTSARVNVSPQWLIDSGNTVGSYGFQTYIHEIGHALGLGHAGNYNTTADYPHDARYANDSWPMSIMSYFSVSENSYFSNLGFTPSYLGTPMVADIAAMQVLYGLSTTTRAGATTYGFNSNAGDIFNASLYPRLAYTIFDSGGFDTLDYSGFTQNQAIHLTSGEFSNVGGRVGLVNIALGTVIENAIGGGGSDTIRGNEVANILTGNLGADTFFGGGGADTFRDTVAGHNGDVILDFTTADVIVFTDANLGSFTFSLVGSTLNYSGGSLTFGSALGGMLSSAAAATGGVQLSLISVRRGNVANDFNGDGRSDILWRAENGVLSDWLGTSTGGFVDNGGNSAQYIPLNWKFEHTGDFNGDGRSDILWREANGAVTTWLGNSNGSFTINDARALQWVPQSWQIEQTGDFNGDGRSDVLWREAGGAITTWLGKADGGFVINDTNSLQWVPLNWQIEQSGDFNGDGRSDILWRDVNGAITTWLGTPNGGFTINDAAALRWVPKNWQIEQSGDFNGDGRSDVLWREAGGAITTWLGKADGGFIINDANALQWVPQNWQIEQAGDFNGDGRSDVLWRETNGAITTWLGKADGGFVINDAHALQWVPLEWQVQTPHADLF